MYKKHGQSPRKHQKMSAEGFAFLKRISNLVQATKKLLAMLHLLLMMSGKKLTYCVKTRSLEAHKDDSREC